MAKNQDITREGKMPKDTMRIHELPIGTDIRGYIRNLVDKRFDLETEIQDKQFEIRQLKEKRNDCDDLMLEAIVETKMFWLLQVNKSKLRKYLNGGYDIKIETPFNPDEY